MLASESHGVNTVLGKGKLRSCESMNQKLEGHGSLGGLFLLQAPPVGKRLMMVL